MDALGFRIETRVLTVEKSYCQYLSTGRAGIYGKG
jgi:hypothetical protein